MTEVEKQVDNLDAPELETSAITEQKGAPGFAIYGGYLVEEESNADLSGTRKYKTYSDILANLGIVAAGVRYFLNLVAKPSWRFEPADDTPQAEQMAELIEDILDDLDTPWHRIIRRSAMYRFYGFSLQLWTAKLREDGNIGFEDIEPRPQVTIERWITNEFGKVLGAVQRSPQTQEEISLERARLVYCVDDSINDSPEGVGLFRHIVRTSEELLRLEQLEGYGFETDLRGIPVGRGPFTEIDKMVNAGELTHEQAAAMKQPLLNFIRKHVKDPQLGLLLDSMPYLSEDESSTPSTVKQWDMSLLSTNGTSLPEIANAIERKNREIARVLGVEGLLLGATSHGSEALSRDKTHNFHLIVDSTLKELVEVYDKDILDRLFELNGWDKSLKPTVKVDSIKYRDIEQITGALKDLSLAGVPMIPGDPAVEEIYELLGLSKPVIDRLMQDTDLALNSGTNEDSNETNQGESETGE